MRVLFAAVNRPKCIPASAGTPGRRSGRPSSFGSDQWKAESMVDCMSCGLSKSERDLPDGLAG
jgi:hypothetical protein